jgi:hypothetical protein
VVCGCRPSIATTGYGAASLTGREVAVKAVKGVGGQGVEARAAVSPQAGLARACVRAAAQFRKVVSRLRRRAGRVCEEDKGRRLGGLLREGIVEYEPKHATLTTRDVVGPHRYFVRVAFPTPFRRNETLARQLFLGGARVPLGEQARLRLGRGCLWCGIEILRAARSQRCAAGAGVLYDAKVTCA